jgi:Asp-tRNA(Asn)/Glu-tRNA(Gln) amidotransferase A subunit family amidase
MAHEPFTRRTFLLGAVAAATSGAVKSDARLETLSEWLAATPKAREQALHSCADRIRTLDRNIHAWVQVSPEPAIGSGKLSGIPFGAKDIIETKGLATEYGSPIYKGRIGTEDAAIVRELRRRGAVLMGKTQTTAFAYRTPAPTRNPRNLEHTPGGSSSGSAAAVAARMIPIALGTQTGGSVLRPASFCGVVGFKPTYGLLPMDGVLPFAKSLDTLGLFTNAASEMLTLWDAMGYATAPGGAVEAIEFAAADPMPEAEPPMTAAFRRAISALRGAGVTVRSIDIAAMLTELSAAARTVMFYEGARFHEQRYKEYGNRLADMADLVREGLQIPVERYDEAKRFIDRCYARVADVYKSTPIILVPAAPGPAPRGLASTGDSRMNAPWTALGTPAISVPMPVGRDLPLGLQLTADRGQEARLLRAAVRVQAAMADG